MSLEDLDHFQVAGSTDDGDADVSLTCMRCHDFNVWIDVDTDEDGDGPTLAALITRADAHVMAAHQ